MMRASEAELRAKLAATGLQLGKFVESDDLVSPADAWSIVSKLDVSPVAVYQCDSDEQFGELRDAWLRTATSHEIVAPDGTFLLSVGGFGQLPWAAVKAGDDFDVRGLGCYRDEPEFVAMDASGRRLCAITTEEGGCWLIVAA